MVWHREAATDAVLLELRAADAAGLLYRVACALDEAGAQVRAARISTLGGDVVDAFYLVGGWPADEPTGPGSRPPSSPPCDRTAGPRADGLAAYEVGPLRLNIRGTGYAR